jgi:hypothetical protein
MTEDNTPSRFHASPAEIDAFLRQHFAEDVLLNYYRAVGDEVLDEIQTSGQTFRRSLEQTTKHVYLSGITDVLAHIQDDRYFPAKLPKLESYNRPWGSPRTVQEWGEITRSMQLSQHARDAQLESLLKASNFPPEPGKVEEEIPAQVQQRLQEAVQRSQDDSAPQPCYRTKAHDPHKWLKGRKAVQCPGEPKA